MAKVQRFKSAPEKKPANAKLEIRIWTSGSQRLPEDDDDLAEAFAPHLEHVAQAVQRGFHSGAIVDDRFGGWWEVHRV